MKNARVAAFYYLVNLILTFLLRKVFIDSLGAELLGLNSTVQDFLNFLNIAELGISSAVSYMLYRPLFEGDRRKINEIISIQGYLYRKIIWVIAGSSLVLMCFFPLIFAKASMVSWYPYATFVILFCNLLFGYIFNYKQIVLTAEQNDYKNLFISQSSKAVKKVLQIPAIMFLPYGYVWWLGIELAFSILGTVLLNRLARREYPWLKVNIRDGKELTRKYPDILIKTKQLFFHRISSFATVQLTPLIIYSYTSLTLVAVYGNYQLIIYGVLVFTEVIFRSSEAGIGNLVAEGNTGRIQRVFWELFASRMWIASCICFGFYVLSSPFVALWVGEEYMMDPWILLVMVATAFCSLLRVTPDNYLSAYGMYQDVWVPCVNIFLAVGGAILLGAYWGLIGILTGRLISTFFLMVWKPYFLYRKGFKKPVANYFVNLVGYTLLATGCGYTVLKITTCYTFAPSMSYRNFLQYGVESVGLYVLFFTILFYIASTGMRRFVKRIIHMCKLVF